MKTFNNTQFGNWEAGKWALEAQGTNNKVLKMTVLVGKAVETKDHVPVDGTFDFGWTAMGMHQFVPTEVDFETDTVVAFIQCHGAKYVKPLRRHERTTAMVLESGVVQIPGEDKGVDGYMVAIIEPGQKVSFLVVDEDGNEFFHTWSNLKGKIKHMKVANVVETKADITVDVAPAEEAAAEEAPAEEAVATEDEKK